MHKFDDDDILRRIDDISATRDVPVGQVDAPQVFVAEDACFLLIVEASQVLVGAAAVDDGHGLVDPVVQVVRCVHVQID